MSTIPYREQLEIIADYRIKDGQEQRGDCPFCGGHNTFSLAKRNGHTMWNCFRASCGVSGSKGGLPSIKSLEASLGLLKSPEDLFKPKKPFPKLPSILTRVEDHPVILKWLKSVNSLEAFERGLIKIHYNPADDRVLFEIPNPNILSSSKLDSKLDGTEEINGFIGRGKKGIIPKWKYYGDTRHIAIISSGPVTSDTIAVVVEDICSACAVGILDGYAGVALMGTHLSQIKRIELKGKFDKILVCLDPDASLKGLEMVTELTGSFESVDMIVPPNDLKYYNEEEIKKILTRTTKDLMKDTHLARSKDTQTIT